MYKILRVGDPHVTVGNIEESRALMDFVLKTAIEKQVRWVEFLGDLFHTHAVVRSEVLDFWSVVFTKFAMAKIPMRVIVGNHDQVGDKERESVHALVPFKNYPYLTIIDNCFIAEPFSYLPYMADEEKFFEAAEKMREAKVLICHQTFQGSTFENGFFATDGIDIARVPQDIVISGHIHKQQKIGKCTYPGTAKWDKATDAGSDKGIWFYEHAEDGSILVEEFITTREIVTPIYRIIIKEGEEEIDLPDGRIALELHGTTTWLTKMKKKYKGKASIRAVPVDRKTAKVDNSKLLSIEDFAMTAFQPIAGVTKEDVVNYIRGINGTGSENING